MSEHVSLTMRETWDALARRNAMHFIATERTRWEPDDFFASGRDTIDRLLRLVDHRPQGVALDLGCGIGRLTFALADHFERAIGVDVSQEMIQRANALKSDVGRTNVSFHCNNGLDISAVPTASCDLAFSYIVLQHVPETRIVHGYIRELARVAKPGGHALFQVPVYRSSLMVPPWRLIQRIFRSVLAPLERVGMVDPENGPAFRGSRITKADLDATLAQSELTVRAIVCTPSAYRFCDDTIVYAVKR